MVVSETGGWVERFERRDGVEEGSACAGLVEGLEEEFGKWPCLPEEFEESVVVFGEKPPRRPASR
jgi:hypothetical protein